jgi:hypothetical protein
MRGPGLTGLRVDMGEAGAGGRIWNADEMVASRALNLPARIEGIALQRLVAMGTIEFEFGVAHSLQLFMRKPTAKSMLENLNTFCRSIAHVRLDEPITNAI